MEQMNTSDLTPSYTHLPRLLIAPQDNPDVTLEVGGTLCLGDKQCHHVVNVLRRRVGDTIRLFTPGGGEYLARLHHIARGSATVAVLQHLRSPPLQPVPLPTLAFGLVKPDALHILIQKATELGVQTFVPLALDRCQYHNLNKAKTQQWLHSAVEQSDQFVIPELQEVTPLASFLESPVPRPILWARERWSLDPVTASPLGDFSSGPPTFLVGPEGGFSRDEVMLLEGNPQVMPVSLGNSILRAETACLFCLAWYRAWQLYHNPVSNTVLDS